MKTNKHVNMADDGHNRNHIVKVTTIFKKGHVDTHSGTRNVIFFPKDYYHTIKMYWVRDCLDSNIVISRVALFYIKETISMKIATRIPFSNTNTH